MSKTAKIKPLTNDQIKLLKKKYYKEKNFFGRDKLFQLVKNEPGHPTKEQVGEWLKTQQIHQLHLKQKKSTILKPIVLKKPNTLYEIDVVDMGKYADGKNRYIFTMLDVFSRFAYGEVMTSKSENAILKAFKSMLNKIDHITRLQSDNGGEFTNVAFKKFCTENNIRQVFTVPGKPQSNGIIERFNGTLKSMIQKEMSTTLNNEWSIKLQPLIDNYNNSFHDTIKMTPVEAQVNTQKAFKNVETRAQKYTGRKYSDIKVGDKVRLKIFKGKLEKHSTVNWSMDLYEVEKIAQPKKSYNSTTYKLKNDPHTYTRNDIQLITEVKKPPQKIREIADGEYEIDEILKKDKRDGKMHYLVKWRGYDASHNTWEKFNNIKSTSAYASFLKKLKK
jgi:transposase InsO family protein